MTATTTAAIRVFLVEDSVLVRHGIRAAIEGEPDGHRIEIVGEAGTAADAIPEIKRLHPDVVLLDLRLPDDNGANVCRHLHQMRPSLCVIVLTSSTDNQSIYDAVVAGAQGYLLKEIDPATLLKAITDGHEGRPVYSGDIATRVLEIIRGNHPKPAANTGLDLLSPQQQRVLEAIAKGHTNKEIATLMGLSGNTVKNYIATMFEKLGVVRRSQAIALYLNSDRNRDK